MVSNQVIELPKICGANKKRRPFDRRCSADVAWRQHTPPGCRSFRVLSDRRSELVEDLVDPEAFETSKGLVQAIEFLVAQAADLIDGLEVAIV